ncbi:16350_t:CDS:2, partial [Dentiscutata erythropus]
MEHAEDASFINENNPSMASETDSVVTTQSSHNVSNNASNNASSNTSNNGGRPLTDIWDEGRAHDMETHLAIKCKGKVPREIRIKVLRDLQSVDESGSSKSTALKKRKSYPSSLSMDTYYNTIEAIDKAKEARANQSLVRWVVSSGISFSAFDNPYFEDFTKILNSEYNSPRRNILALSVLDAEAANIILKIEKELSKAKNLTLCIDSWCSPLKHSIYAFVIMTNERKQYVYSLRDFSKFSHTANFNAEKMIEILEKVGPEKFIAITTDAESAMMAAKRQVIEKYPNILPIRCIAHHIQLISSSICKLPLVKKILSNCQSIVSFFKNSYCAGAALREEIIFSSTVGGNLKSMTKTRWSTAWDSCKSILRNEANIRS